MRIAFDMDKVFVNYPPFVPYFVIDKLSKKPTKDLSYRYPARFEQKIRILSHHPKLRPSIESNVNTLALLSRNKKLDLYLISGRYSFLKKRTNEWFRNNSINTYFKKMYFNYHNEQPHLFKNRLIRSLQIEKYIDDDLELLFFLAEKNPSIIFYWITNHPLPKVFLTKNIVAIKSLDELNNSYL